MSRLVGTEEVVDQMVLFSHYVSSSASPTSMLMMIHMKEYHLMMVGTDVVECLLIRHEGQACWYVVTMMLCITSNDYCLLV